MIICFSVVLCEAWACTKTFQTLHSHLFRWISVTSQKPSAVNYMFLREVGISKLFVQQNEVALHILKCKEYLCMKFPAGIAHKENVKFFLNMFCKRNKSQQTTLQCFHFDYAVLQGVRTDLLCYKLCDLEFSYFADVSMGPCLSKLVGIHRKYATV